MKTILLLTAFVAVAWADPRPLALDHEWKKYKSTFGKFYTSETEDTKRLNAYLETKRKVEEHNQKCKKGETSYTVEANKFADWFPKELQKLNGLKGKEMVRSGDRKVFKLLPGAKVPEEINWVEKGAVTRVKNQGRCGSCYAFSAAGALEGLMYITNKTITDLSVQELVDCSSSYENKGCEGGYMSQCFQYVIDRRGISTEKSYPYKAVYNTCRMATAKLGAACTDYVELPQTENDLKNALGSRGPVAIGFGVAINLMFYKKGIYDGKCSRQVNHGMLAVGYGKDKETGKDFWLVKNSWGEDWGMNGYVKIIRGLKKCGIHELNSFPVYKKRNKKKGN